MSAQAERLVILPSDEAGYIDAQIASGGYASAAEVVRAALRALRERDLTECWLREEVLPVADAVEADPSQLIPIEDVFADIRALHETWLDKQSR